jgi:putative hydrolase of the HAD superfamily
MRSQPTALLFDFGGTLDADGISWRDRVFRLYREAGVTVTAEEFAPHFYRADDGLVGALPATCSLDETVARLFTGLTATLCPGVPPGLATRLAGHFVDDVRRHARASAAILAGLRPRYHLGLVSNFYGNLETVGADLALTPLLGVMVDSTRVGVTKPDPRIFKTATCAARATSGCPTSGSPAPASRARRAPAAPTTASSGRSPSCPGCCAE